MDVKAYIESGVLEMYVMQALSAAESREIEQLAEQHPEIRVEIERIEQAMSAYALKHAQAPRSDLKAEIFSNIPDQPKLQAQVQSGSNFGIVAAVIGLLIAIAAGIFLYSKWQNAENQLQQVVAEKATLEAECQDTQRQLNIITNPDTKSIELEGLPIAPQSRVIVYWNQSQRTTLLSVKNLPPPPSGKQYQLWAIAGNNPPVNAGVFDVNTGILQVMERIAEANAFAVTLEDAGGSPTPTLDQMFVIGNVG